MVFKEMKQTCFMCFYQLIMICNGWNKKVLDYRNIVNMYKS